MIAYRIVLTGSFNWSFSAEWETFDNLFLIDNPILVASYIQNFQKVFKYGGVDGYQKLMESIAKGEGRTSPGEIDKLCLFEPLSLTFEQIVELRKSFDLHGYQCSKGR